MSETYPCRHCETEVRPYGIHPIEVASGDAHTEARCIEVLKRQRDEARRALPPPKAQPEWCAHCPFPKHLHYNSDGSLAAPCIGFVPQGAARCDKRDGEGRRCSLVADHGGHHEIQTPYDPDAKPMPRAQVSASAG